MLIEGATSAKQHTASSIQKNSRDTTAATANTITTVSVVQIMTDL